MRTARNIIYFLGRLPTTVFDCLLTYLSCGKGRPTSAFMVSIDDGPCPQSTPALLDELNTVSNRKGLPVKAGFFLIGEDLSGSRRLDIWAGRRRPKSRSSPNFGDSWPVPGVRRHPEFVRAIEEAGHYAMVHSQRHKDFSACTAEEMEAEITGCFEILVAAGAKPLRYFRPPYLRMPQIPPSSRLVKERWGLISGVSSGDSHPCATEESVIRCCIRRIKRHAGPVVLIFHDFRGLPAYRLSIANIVEGLKRAGYFLEDFDPEVVSKPLRMQGPERG